MNTIEQLNFVYLNSNSISEELCKDIISLFENDKTEKTKGVTRGGLNVNVKDTTDFEIPKNNDSDWNKIYFFLQKELIKNLMKYCDREKKNNLAFCDELKIHFDIFMIQKYYKNKGKYIYHNDFCVQANQYRILTYLWYLNTVEEGGETEFLGKYKIKPETGKLLLFPASWTFPHCGKMPISEDKYIITGWIYVDNN